MHGEEKASSLRCGTAPLPVDDAHDIEVGVYQDVIAFVVRVL